MRAQLESQGDKVSLAKGMLLRQDGDATWQILRDTFTRIDAGQKGCS